MIFFQVNDPKRFNSSVYMTSKLTDFDWKPQNTNFDIIGFVWNHHLFILGMIY